MTPLRICLIGSGTVGTWLLGVLDAQAERLASRYGAEVTVVGLANARDGFVYDPGGLDVPPVLAALAEGRPITGQRGARHWPSALEGLRATEADLLVEVSASPPADGEPGTAHIREALRARRGLWASPPGIRPLSGPCIPTFILLPGNRPGTRFPTG